LDCKATPEVGQKNSPSHASGIRGATWGTTAKPTPTARDLAAALPAVGLRPGTPAHLAARAECIDRQLCGALRCPGCRRRGLSYLPFTDGRRYLVLAVCRCGAAVEV
jgi:hypothetical protein